MVAFTPRGGLLGLALIAAVLATSLPVPRAAAARKPAPKPGKPPVSVKAVVDYQSIYDDNIFRFSDENLLAYRRGESPWKFGMDTYDDFILSPRFTVDLGRKLLGSKETTFRVKYTLWQYASNPNKSNSQWFVRLRQPMRGKDALELARAHVRAGLAAGLARQAGRDIHREDVDAAGVDRFDILGPWRADRPFDAGAENRVDDQIVLAGDSRG